MKKSPFQYFLLAVFGALALAAIGVFVVWQPDNSQYKGAKGNISIWGTFPATGELNELFGVFNDDHKDMGFTISYEFKDPKKFDTTIVEALASNRGPDILLLPNDLILRYSDRVQVIPFTQTFGAAEYQRTFLQAGEIYQRQDGFFAIPFAVDPMVMYWNRDLFANVSKTQPPKYWDELLTLAPLLTKKDAQQNIIQSAVALGEYSNVPNAKDILVNLFLQVGNPVIRLTKGMPEVTLGPTTDIGDQTLKPVESALRFFLDFSNPQKSTYTWNRSRLRAEDEFVNGDLAIYFDLASKKKILENRNPHLNIAVAQVPLPRGASAEITYARMHGLAVMKKSQNPATAFAVIQELLLPKYAGAFAKVYELPPVNRDLLQVHPSDATQAVFYDAAIRSRTWLDPRQEESEKAFNDMVEKVSSGRVVNISAALEALVEKLQNIIAASAG